MWWPGADRTTDMRTFSPSDRRPFLQNPAGNPSVLVVEAEIKYAEKLTLSIRRPTIVADPSSEMGYWTRKRLSLI
jgi:hypothetical protein